MLRNGATRSFVHVGLLNQDDYFRPSSGRRFTSPRVRGRDERSSLLEVGSHGQMRSGCGGLPRTQLSPCARRRPLTQPSPRKNGERERQHRRYQARPHGRPKRTAAALPRRGAWLLRAGRNAGPRVAADRDRRRCRRWSTGIPGGRRSGPNDRPGLDAGGGPPGGESPAGCHCNEWQPAAACAAARQRAAGLLAGILRAFRTSLTSTSAGRGRPVRSSGQLGRDHPSTQARSARSVLLCCGVTSPGIAGLLSPELLLPMCLLCWLVDRLVSGDRTPGAERTFRSMGHYAGDNGLSSRFRYPPGRIMIILRGG